MAAFTLFGRKTGGNSPARKPLRCPAVAFEAAGAPAAADRVALVKAAKKLPGFRPARRMIGEGLARHATAILIDHGGESLGVQHRIDNSWQATDPLARDAGDAILAAVKTAAATKLGASKDVLEGECVVRVGKVRRPCRITVRATPRGEQVLIVFGGELSSPAQPASGGLVAGLLGRLLRRGTASAAAARRAGPIVTLDVVKGGDADQAIKRLEQAVASPGYQPACDLVAAALAARATELLIDCTQKEVAGHGDVDGVWRPLQTLDRAAGDGAVAALKMAAGADPRERRQTQAGPLVTVVDGKPWPCRLRSQGVTTGERVQLSFDYGRPKIKSLADAGMSAPLAARLAETMALEGGLVVLATPRRGGLSTLFDCVIHTADRMLREFVIVEDATSPRPEIQNVKPARWDAAKQVSPVAAVDLALREYPGAFVTCDLSDADLARKLVDQAGQGRLVVLGIRGHDAADGLANLRALGVDATALGHVLLAAVGGRLVRKLCPKCHEDYLPSLDLMAKLKLDPAAAPTLRRAGPGGCPICTETGYLGRTGVFEIASGRTLNAYLAKGADAKVLRQAAAKDGMRSLQHDALGKVAEGVTSIDEVQRVFAKA